jgi:hypothetical protein
MAETPEMNQPDFRNGFPIRDFGNRSMISGQADGEELVLVRRGDEVFAIGAHCTHSLGRKYARLSAVPYQKSLAQAGTYGHQRPGRVRLQDTLIQYGAGS